jgi:hypothetical protein
MTADERDLTPPGVFTQFPLEPLPADLLSGGSGLLRNLDRMAERVRDEAIAEFMATPEAQAAEAELIAAGLIRADDATERVTGERPHRPRDGVRIRDEDGPVEAEPERSRYRPEQVHARGRWRARKQVLRAFAAELGWPGCLEVTHDDSIVGSVLQAGLRIRDWRRFERSGRRAHERAAAERACSKQRRSNRRKRLAEGDIPF